jgi:hypothetical protein
VQGAALASLDSNPEIEMQIELSHTELETIRDVLRQRVVELDKEINRTDSLEFKRELQELNRTIERALGSVSSVLERSPRA